jgi:hypothetical protein
MYGNMRKQLARTKTATILVNDKEYEVEYQKFIRMEVERWAVDTNFVAGASQWLPFTFKCDEMPLLEDQAEVKVVRSDGEQFLLSNVKFAVSENEIEGKSSRLRLFSLKFDRARMI